MVDKIYIDDTDGFWKDIPAADLSQRKRGRCMTKEQKCLMKLAQIKVQEEELLDRKKKAEAALADAQEVKPDKVKVEAGYIDTLLKRIKDLEDGHRKPPSPTEPVTVKQFIDEHSQVEKRQKHEEPKKGVKKKTQGNKKISDREHRKRQREGRDGRDGSWEDVQTSPNVSAFQGSTLNRTPTNKAPIKVNTGMTSALNKLSVSDDDNEILL